MQQVHAQATLDAALTEAVPVLMQAQAQKQKMSAKAQKKFAKRQAYGSSLPVNGLSSTLAFTPIQVC